MTMNQFSFEVHKQKHDGNYDRAALEALRQLKERSAGSGDLFESSAAAKEKFEACKTLFADEWKILQNDEAFNELGPKEQQEVLFKLVNTHERPKSPVVVGEI